MQRLFLPTTISARAANLWLALLLMVGLAGCGAQGDTQSGGQTGSEQPKTIRVGYQKFGTLTVLKAQGGLEQRLAPQGIKVEWLEFPGGPQLLEALNTGSIDFGTVGEAPPIFAQAAGTPLIYVASNPGSPAGEAILVPKDSPIKSVAELKGKKVVLNKGSNVHYLLVRALESAGLAYTDIETVFLPPADARAAFEGGSVDAWVIWDPFLAVAEDDIGARVLEDGEGLVANRIFYLSSRSFAERSPDLVQVTLEELAKVEDWVKSRPAEAAALLAPQVGIKQPTLERVIARTIYGVDPVDETVVSDQQKIADVFFQLQLIPNEIKIKDATLPRTFVSSAQR